MRVGTVHDAAAELGLSVDKVRGFAKAGILPVAFRIGPRYRFDLDAIKDWRPPPPRPRRRTRSRLDAMGVWILTDARIAELPTTGWCYLIQSEHGGPVKIGKTDDVEDRLRKLQFSCPYRLVVRAKLPGGRQTEARLHKQFSRFRLHGEWFDDRAPGLSRMLRAAA